MNSHWYFDEKLLIFRIAIIYSKLCRNITFTFYTPLLFRLISVINFKINLTAKILHKAEDMRVLFEIMLFQTKLFLSWLHQFLLKMQFFVKDLRIILLVSQNTILIKRLLLILYSIEKKLNIYSNRVIYSTECTLKLCRICGNQNNTSMIIFFCVCFLWANFEYCKYYNPSSNKTNLLEIVREIIRRHYRGNDGSIEECEFQIAYVFWFGG